MKEKLYIEYVKKCRLFCKSLMPQEEFFALIESVKDLFSSDPLVTGELKDEEWEVIFS